jgi:hypothetical protein
MTRSADRTLIEPPTTHGFHALIHCILVQYLQHLRAKNPGKRIRNADVFRSAVPTLAGHGYIELVDPAEGIPDWVPDEMVRTLHRRRYRPAWLPGPRFPDDALLLGLLIWPSLDGDHIVWHHKPSETAHQGWSRRRGEQAQKIRSANISGEKRIYRPNLGRLH